MTPANGRFVCGHATHPQWAMAAGLVVAQLRAQCEQPGVVGQPNLGLVYLTDAYAPHAGALLDHLRQALPQVRHWCGSVGVGVCASGVEYFDEPGLVVMLCELPPDQFQVFNGLSPMGQQAPAGFQAHTALVHADPMTPMLGELIEDVAALTQTGVLFGGLCASRQGPVQLAVNGWDQRAQSLAHNGVFEGGITGVAFGAEVALISRVTQGCQPVGPAHRITRAQGHVVHQLDDQAALSVLMSELGVSLDDPERAVAQVRRTLVGVSPASSAQTRSQGRQDFGEQVRVRHIIGLDPGQQAVAIADEVSEGMALSFCRQDVTAARADLMRMAAELRDSLEEQAGAQIRGAIYVSCSGRGGPHFGGASAELLALQQALGDVPLAGFFAAGEIAHSRIHGYTGVLTVFTTGDA